MTRRLVFLLLGAVLAGCGSDSSLPTTGPVGVYEAVGEGGASAEFEGTLKYNDGCVTVVASQPGGEREVVPLFPDEAEWTNNELRFRDESYRSGSRVSLGGSLGSDASAYVPSACDANLPTWIVHQDTKTL